MSVFDETAWWGDCANTYHEEGKQIVYAQRMGLLPSWHGAHPPTFNLAGRSVVDIGGGPVSLLLKCVNRGGHTYVVDPGRWPEWVTARYEHSGIMYLREQAEAVVIWERDFDEAWIYNTLQHVDDPERVIANARRWASTVRLFEWIDLDPYPGHPHRLTRDDLDRWLGAPGFVTSLDEHGCVGTAYYGVFRGS